MTVLQRWASGTTAGREGLTPLLPTKEPLAATHKLLEAELEFYSGYEWCLDPHLTIPELVRQLGSEGAKLKSIGAGWQATEVATNVFLLSCALLNAVDEYLRGPALVLPARLMRNPVGKGAALLTENAAGFVLRRRWKQARHWREQWQSVLDEVLGNLSMGASHSPALVEAADALSALLTSLPRNVQAGHISPPSAFRRLDITHDDIVALGRRAIELYPNLSTRLLVLGVRTGGTYFASFLRAFLKANGYQAIASLTVDSKKSPGKWERKQLGQLAEQGFSVLIVDDPPSTGETIILALGIARKAGFAREQIRALVPIHPAKRNWLKFLPSDLVIPLAPEDWSKEKLLTPEAVETRVAEYFHAQDYSRVRVVKSRQADAFNLQLLSSSSGERGSRLKRIYEVALRTPEGEEETQFILAKSVGWGWLGYHAFLAGHRLAGFVPPILGLRDGILYMQWLPDRSPPGKKNSRQDRIETSASYVAGRVRSLPLGNRPLSSGGVRRHENGMRTLEKVLSKAYGPVLSDTLMRPCIARNLGRLPCPVPTLIDGKMGTSEWVVGPHGYLKTDYEHHGMGKTELNIVDPAYDLSETILHLSLSAEEEAVLVRQYVEASDDPDVESRLFMNKLLAGLWSMKAAQEKMFGKSQTADRQRAHHDSFIQAWNFLTVQTARFCGRYCKMADPPRWRTPLVALDIDGVLDRRIFGYPCTTRAGIEALRLLAKHHVSVALNTARSVSEVRDYCKAYGFAGGVAETGAYMWDAVAQRGRVLISSEALLQLEELRVHLRGIPGVFLDDRHEYSIRAYTYEESGPGLLSLLLLAARSSGVGSSIPVPLPTLLINDVIERRQLDLLVAHRTMIDTTVVVRDVDKGTGLLALRDWVIGAHAETIAVGDSDADLSMFAAATRSFAPAQINCPSKARLLGTKISKYPYQRGLVDIARLIVSANGPKEGSLAHEIPDDCFFLELLRAADLPRPQIFASSLFRIANLKAVWR